MAVDSINSSSQEEDLVQAMRPEGVPHQTVVCWMSASSNCVSYQDAMDSCSVARCCTVQRCISLGGGAMGSQRIKLLKANLI